MIATLGVKNFLFINQISAKCIGCLQWSSDSFSKVLHGCFSRFLNCANGTLIVQAIEYNQSGNVVVLTVTLRKLFTNPISRKLWKSQKLGPQVSRKESGKIKENVMVSSNVLHRLF